MSPLSQIIYALRARRYELQLSQKILARKMNTSRRVITSWECGERTPKLERLLEWANVLGLQLELSSKSTP